MAGLLANPKTKAADAEANPEPHFTPRAKRLIFVSLQGSPSQIDTFDYKPRLQKDDGKAVAEGTGNPLKYLGSPWKFSQHGQSGHWISELYPTSPGTPTNCACSRA